MSSKTAQTIQDKSENVELSQKLESILESLKDKENYNRALFELSPAGMVLVDTDARIVDANPAFCKLLGRDSTKVINTPLTRLIPKKHLNANCLINTEDKDRQARGPTEIEYFHQSGELILVRQYCSILYKENKKHILICLEDISGLENSAKRLKSSEEKYRGIYDSIRDGIVRTDLEGNIRDANPAFCRIVGYSAPELSRKTIYGITPEKWHTQQDLIYKTVLKKGSYEDITKEYLHKDGTLVPVQVNTWLILDNQQMPSGCWAIVRNMTEKHKMQLRLDTTQQRYKVLVDTLPHGVLIVRDRIIVFSNKGSAPMFGHEHADELEGQDFISHVLPAEKEKIALLLKKVLKNRITGNRYIETVLLKANGAPFPAELYVRELPHEGENYLQLVVMDITDRKVYEDKLTKQAFYDQLTGLPNRALLMTRLAQALEKEKSKGHLYALMFLDLDRFRLINETLGHNAGDKLLVALSRRLERCVRSIDTVARMGSDEFAILLEEVDTHREAVRMAKEMIRTAVDPFFIEGHELHSQIIIGMVLSPVEYDKPDDVLQNAEIALNRAKKTSKSGFKVFNSRMHEEAVSRLKAENALRKAVRDQEFITHYQPIYNLRNLNLYGFEALVRWMRPGFGLVHPGDFIAMAEETGLIIPIGQWVLEESCRFLATWQKEKPESGSLVLDVNLSAKQFLQPDLVDMVAYTIRETGINPRSLNLEITETVVMEDAKRTIQKLKQLKDLGLRLSVDDFGTGYSSLSYLQKFPLDMLKVDRSFVTGIAQNTENFEIVRAIVLLAKSLDMTVVAEGVETESQLMLLTQLQCEYGQGFHFARPMEEMVAQELMATSLRSEHTFPSVPPGYS